MSVSAAWTPASPVRKLRARSYAAFAVPLHAAEGANASRRRQTRGRIHRRPCVQFSSAPRFEPAALQLERSTSVRSPVDPPRVLASLQPAAVASAVGAADGYALLRTAHEIFSRAAVAVMRRCLARLAAPDGRGDVAPVICTRPWPQGSCIRGEITGKWLTLNAPHVARRRHASDASASPRFEDSSELENPHLAPAS